MTNLTEQRLWVVVHLLYPNSSQALDVYYTLLSFVSKKSEKYYAHNLYKKLVQLYLKTEPVRSSQPFQVFENQKLDNWNIIYKRSPKQQLLVLCGLIVFKFTTEELGEILGIPEQKIKFLVNQSFKKTSQISILKPAVKTDFSYKKKSENQVSYLFTNENLVEHGLGLLNEDERSRVDQGLSIYKQLVPLQSYYKEIIDEMQNLIGDQANPYFVQAAEAQPELDYEQPTISFDFLKVRKKLIALSVASVLFIALVSIRPSWLRNLSFKSGTKSIVVQEIKSQPYMTEKDSVAKNDDDQINLHEMPVAKNEAANSTKDKLPGTVVAAVGLKSVTKAETKIEPKPEAKPIVAKADSKPVQKTAEPSAKKVSGLYRASIVVTDLNSTASRITEKLVALGGKKAGEVELGWKKTPTLSYYHLTIPEENLEAAKTFLGNFGKLNIQFENHPRLVTAGTNRIILEVKESE
ncbi:MAG: hypothetical protein H7256_14655 [Bdellovibrio sp.]|nr:hypothetical protein [Bdellovibrio sp.]